MPVFRRDSFGPALLRFTIALALAAALTPPARAHPAWAAGYVINDTSDTSDGDCGDGTCSVRDAITAANSNPGPDTISFAVSGIIVLGSLLPVVEEDLTIDGSGQTVALDGNQAFRVLRANAPLTLTTLIVQNGNSVGDGAGALFFSAGTLINTTFISNTADGTGGGGAHFWSTGTVVNSTFRNNLAPNGSGGGAHFVSSAMVTGTAFISNTAPNGTGGGAHFNVMATVANTSFTNNRAMLGGGARFGGLATVTGTTFLDNTAIDGNGGGARFGSTATVSNSTFAGNAAANGAGGGARFDGTSTVTGTSFTGNTARLGGGADFVQPAMVVGATFLSNTGFSGGGGAAFAQTATISSTSFLSNTAPNGSGGGTRFEGITTVSTSTFSRNSAGGTGGGGGALFISPATVTGATFTGNTATIGTGGGARFLSAANITSTSFVSNTANSDRGGGAHFLSLAMVADSTFLSNSAADGGAVAAEGANSVLQNNLIQGNTAGNTGGGVYVRQATDLTLAVNRVLQNQAGDGGGVAAALGASISLENNLLVGNSADDPGGAAEIVLADDDTHLAGQHNTLAAATPGSGLAVRDDASATGQSILLTNSIFDGYAVGALASTASPAMELSGVLWSGVTTPTQGVGIVVTNAITGSADFANPGAGDYHLQRTSDAFDAGGDAGVAMDIDGEIRPQFAAFDFGFDEILNNPPTAVDDGAVTPEETSITLSVLANDNDPDQDALSVSAVGAPDNGTATISGTSQIVYTPAVNFNGQAVFTYTASDGANPSTALVTVTITPLNDLPSISGPSDIYLVVGNSSGPLSFTVNDVDAGDTLTVTATSTNTVLVANANIVLGGSGSARTVVITPAAGQRGNAQVILTVSDSFGAVAQTSFRVTVDFGIFLPVIRR